MKFLNGKHKDDESGVFKLRNGKFIQKKHAQ
ncbi:hypothetical protein FIC_00061 [Flavobacteriaceae bacterium 3519-10]|nr:hypothetical protein FIC_00061 [Flavobacteriaceae bacterium 3519-10]